MNRMAWKTRTRVAGVDTYFPTVADIDARITKVDDLVSSMRRDVTAWQKKKYGDPDGHLWEIDKLNDYLESMEDEDKSIFKTFVKWAARWDDYKESWQDSVSRYVLGAPYLLTAVALPPLALVQVYGNNAWDNDTVPWEDDANSWLDKWNAHGVPMSGMHITGKKPIKVDEATNLIKWLAIGAAVVVGGVVVLKGVSMASAAGRMLPVGEKS